MPPVPVGNLLRQVPSLVRQCVAMAFEHRSRPRGRPPAWLAAASDVRLVGLTGGDEATVRFDTPVLGEAASAIYAQGELFPTRPSPEDTSFDLLGDVLRDVARRDGDSHRYDGELLRSVARLGTVVNGEFSEMVVSGVRYAPGSGAVVNGRTVQTAKELYSRTPNPSRARVVGLLDQFRISTHAFGMRLDTGEEIRGVVGEDDIDAALELFRRKQRVVVRGRAFFRPSGQLLLLDVDDVEEANGESSVWSRAPKPGDVALDQTRLRRRQGKRSGLPAVVGRWPGDETDEQVEEALRRIS